MMSSVLVIVTGVVSSASDKCGSDSDVMSSDSDKWSSNNDRCSVSSDGDKCKVIVTGVVMITSESTW